MTFECRARHGMGSLSIHHAPPTNDNAPRHELACRHLETWCLPWQLLHRPSEPWRCSLSHVCPSSPSRAISGAAPSASSSCRLVKSHIERQSRRGRITEQGAVLLEEGHVQASMGMSTCARAWPYAYGCVQHTCVPSNHTSLCSVSPNRHVLVPHTSGPPRGVADIVFCPILITRFYHVLSCPVLPCPALSGPILCCPIAPFHAASTHTASKQSNALACTACSPRQSQTLVPTCFSASA